MRVAFHDGVHVLPNLVLVNLRRHDMPVCQYAPGAVDEEARAIEYGRRPLDVGKARREPLQGAVVGYAREIEMLTVGQGDVIIKLIANEHHPRLLLVEDFLRVFLATCHYKEKQE